MNKISRSMWNDVTCAWTAASKFIRASAKKSSVKNGVISLVAAGFLSAGTAYAATAPVAVFNDATDDTCAAVNDGIPGGGTTTALTSPACQATIGNKSSSQTALASNTSLNLISNSSGLIARGGLEIFGDGVSAGSPVAYLHGQLSLFSNGTTSGTANKIIGVAAGTVSAASTDAVNGSQLYGVSQSVAGALGGNSTVNPDGSVARPQYDIGGSTFYTVGDALNNLDGRTAQNTDSIANINSILNNIGGGAGIMYFHSNSTLVDSQAMGVDSVAIGGNAQAWDEGSVALGANSVANRPNSVSVGSVGKERQITNVAAGTADTDAVNVSQLKAAGLVDKNGNANAAVIYDHNADGSVDYGSVTMGGGASGGTTIHNVAAGVADTDAVNVAQMNAALGAVANVAVNATNPLFTASGDRNAEAAMASGTHATAMGANASAAGVNAVAVGAGSAAQADNSVALGANSVADRANSVSVGAVGSERQLTNVAAGQQGTDAVNVDQLNAATTQANSYTDNRIAGVQNSINEVAKNAYAGVAAAMAMPNMTPSGPGRTVVAAGGGTYKGASAAAAGVTYRSLSGHWLANGAVSVTSTGDAGVRAQVGYEF